MIAVRKVERSFGEYTCVSEQCVWHDRLQCQDLGVFINLLGILHFTLCQLLFTRLHDVSGTLQRLGCCGCQSALTGCVTRAYATDLSAHVLGSKRLTTCFHVFVATQLRHVQTRLVHPVLTACALHRECVKEEGKKGKKGKRGRGQGQGQGQGWR